MLSCKVKICGLRKKDSLEAAINAGADYAGYVFFAKSPRNISLDAAADLAKSGAGKIESVALCVNPVDELINDIAMQVVPDWIQLHGSETPEQVRHIKKLSGCQILKAISVSEAGDVLKAKDYEGIADLILFDAKPIPGKHILPGGNGLTFDWTHLEQVKGKLNYMLSGGLNPDNVKKAVELTEAYAVDVSSGVETEPGVKNLELIQKFVLSAKTD